ncbi:sporulation initiation factor Spo0A C-terminal domain-containing protein [Lacrimispora sp.]|uniref:sporulation initiation factor Spo0A C-terminal domain-containing protein n=1 Tax=Lacrimispora sp. TaxID=2719234 RepID=UPI00289F3D75|nr:sporulation initiation factor Spo0A C-terminal domain-containing protein [Lacrimispora sp.]
MIKDRAKDLLIKMGMPASILGFKYIADAMELFDSGFEDIKIMALYPEIGRKNNTTGSRVERAIRHSFETLVSKGQQDLIEKYLSLDNTTNSNMLKLLYYRLKQEEMEENQSEIPVALQESNYAIGPDPYQTLEDEMILAVQRFIKNLREVNTDVCSKVS